MKWKDGGRRAWVVLWGIVPLFLFVGLTAGVAWSDNSLCLGCHQDESLKKIDARGKSISLFVSESEFKNSAHGKLSCSDCHTHIKDDAHAEGGKKAADKSVHCGACHKGADKEYQQGLHAKMIMKGTERPANCYDCHGKHNILPSKNSKSMTQASNIDRTCNRCHSDVGSLSHGFRILAWQDIMFSVTIIAIGCSLRSLHDHLGMKALLVFLLRLPMASCAVHTLIRSLLPTLGMCVILNMGMAV